METRRTPKTRPYVLCRKGDFLVDALVIHNDPCLEQVVGFGLSAQDAERDASSLPI